MKKFKKLIALTCVAAMLVPTVAFAEESATAPSTGNTIIENDNSKEPVYTAVQLPTITSCTYNFTIDRDGLLDEFDYVGNYEAGSSVYFTKEDAAATLTYTKDGGDTNTYTLNKKTFVVDTVQTGDDQPDGTTASFLTKITNGATLDDTEVALTTAKAYLNTAANQVYYVWVPVDYTDDAEHAAEARGKFVKITDANVDKYVELKETSTDVYEYVLREDHDSGADIWDGKIYIEKYEALSAADAVDYVKMTVTPGADGNPDTITFAALDAAATDETAVLYLGTSTDGVAYTYAAFDATAFGKLKYTDATIKYADTSDKAKVVNKSTHAIVVTVQIDVTNDAGITYSATNDVADTENASLYLAITDGTNYATVNNSTASAYYILDGAENDSMRYQVEGSSVTATGSHEYAKYELPNPEYDEAEFYIEADVNEAEAADGAWADYIATLTATENANTKPSIQVVYSWEEVEKATTTDEETGVVSVVAGKFVDTTGTTYTKKSAGEGLFEGWATKAVLETTISGNTYSRSNTANTYAITWADDVTDENKVITGIYAGMSATTCTTAIPAASYTLTGNTLTIDGVKNTTLGAPAVGNTRCLKVVFKDNSYVIINLTNITN